ncbi:clotting factor G beta subunit-like [Penaeus vannamei]|uniref:clotting factor G beta subunit-like n=1 Tax=Penaeus vannamei TaxID=6689 RepID=UPI00387F416D
MSLPNDRDDHSCYKCCQRQGISLNHAVVRKTDMKHVRNRARIAEVAILVASKDRQALTISCREECEGRQGHSELHLGARNPDVVRLGEHDYDDPSETTHEDYAISQTVVYPHYVPEQAYHDLALIKLDRKVQIKDFIRPVCLPWNQRNPSRLVNSGVTVTGWGRTQSGGRRSSTLQEVELKVFPSSRCHVQYKELVFFNRVWPSGIAGETMCAGTTTGGKDACQGDSGGPAVHHECKRYTLAGVISKGYDCGLRDFAGLYVNVRQRFYLQWIKETAF